MNTTAYKPTIMERILKGNYKWWYYLGHVFKSSTIYRGSTLIYMVGRFLILGLTILIWYLNIQAGSNLLSFETVFTYYIAGSLFSFSSGMEWNVGQAIKDGSLSSSLIKPQPYFVMAIIGDFGWWLFSNIIETIILLVLIAIGFQFLIVPTLINLSLFMVLCVISYFIKVMIQIIIGTFAFYLIDINGVMNITGQLQLYLSGKALPLNVAGILLPITVLPWAFTYFYPVQVFLGEYTLIQSLGVIAASLVWLIVLAGIAKMMFLRGLKKFESVGL